MVTEKLLVLSPLLLIRRKEDENVRIMSKTSLNNIS